MLAEDEDGKTKQPDEEQETFQRLESDMFGDIPNDLRNNLNIVELGPRGGFFP